MNPLDSVVLSAIEIALSSGMSEDQAIKELTSKISEKQNRYKWREKLKRLLEQKDENSQKCPYTMDFIEQLGL